MKLKDLTNQFVQWEDGRDYNFTRIFYVFRAWKDESQVVIDGIKYSGGRIDWMTWNQDYATFQREWCVNKSKDCYAAFLRSVFEDRNV